MTALKTTTARTRVGRLCGLAVAVALGVTPAAAGGGEYADGRYDFSLTVPAPWADAPLASVTVPGVARSVWSGPANASIVAFVQEPGTAFSPRFLVDESAKAVREKLGCDVRAAEVRTVGGKKAMWLVFTGKGTGGALTGKGQVETAMHWVAVPREKDVVVVLLTCPADDYEERRPSFEKAVASMKVGGTQTAEQSGAK